MWNTGYIFVKQQCKDLRVLNQWDSLVEVAFSRVSNDVAAVVFIIHDVSWVIAKIARLQLAMKNAVIGCSLWSFFLLLLGHLQALKYKKQTNYLVLNDTNQHLKVGWTFKLVCYHRRAEWRKIASFRRLIHKLVLCEYQLKPFGWNRI